MKNIDFFFDFYSPYAYLAHCKVPEIAERHGWRLTYKPIDLLKAKLAAGNNGPQNAAIPTKIQYLFADLGRWAQRYGVPLTGPKTPDMNPTIANIGTFFAIERGQERNYVNAVWRRWFGAGEPVVHTDALAAVARELGWAAEEFINFVNSADGQQRYAQTNSEAHERGVFGVPIALIGTEMWWGNDRLDFLEEYIASAPASLTPTELHPVSQ